MGLYVDEGCIRPRDADAEEDADYGYKDYDYYLNGGYYDYGDDDYDDDGNYAAEQNLTDLNGVLDELKYCTPCMDYPSYQDGEEQDDDGLFNQCWKFHSHDSYQCGASCVAMGSSQETVMRIDLGDRSFGDDRGFDWEHGFDWDGVASYGADDDEGGGGYGAYAVSNANRGNPSSYRNSRGGWGRGDIIRENALNLALVVAAAAVALGGGLLISRRRRRRRNGGRGGRC